MTTTPAKRRPGPAAITEKNPVTFMGQTFTSRSSLSEAFPAFNGDDAVRALLDGCTTVMEVEAHSYLRRQEKKAQQREAAHLLQAMRGQGKKPRRKRKARA